MTSYEGWSIVEDESCPSCRGIVERRDWWDDDPEVGGEPIGTEWRCTVCGWRERQ